MRPSGNRNALNREIGEDGLRDWSFGMYGCLDTRHLCNEIYPISCMLSNPNLKIFYLLLQVAGPRFVLAWYTARTSSVYSLCTNTALLSRVEVKDAVTTVGFIAVCQSLVSFGFFRYVVNGGRVRCALNPAALRWGVGLISGITMTSVGRAPKIASTRCVVARVRSRRKAGRLSWKRRVLPSREAYQLRPRDTLDNLPIVSPVPLFAVQYEIPTLRAIHLTVQF
jgi:hypothetical protein